MSGKSKRKQRHTPADAKRDDPTRGRRVLNGVWSVLRFFNPIPWFVTAIAVAVVVSGLFPAGWTGWSGW